MNTPPMHWPVPFVDAYDREGELIVYVRDGEVRFRWPPGEGGTLPAKSDDKLCDAILDARRIANETRTGA